MSETIAYRIGTYRAASPEETWARVLPLLPRFGITRVADITRLDDIGVPVHLAYRPTGLTYAVSIGSGGTALQSQVSAVMESIEAWHAENLQLAIAARAPAADLDLGYDVRWLNLSLRSPLTDSVELDWVAGRGLLSGREVLVPIDVIRMDLTVPKDWARVLFRPTSSGLATGNTAAEATLHGLHELIERDCMAAYCRTPVAQRRYVDPSGCQNPLTRQVYDALRAAGCRIVICDITGPTGVPCYAAAIWAPDVPMRCGGFGCHVDPAIAIGRAMAEAVQSRMAAIAGARDDIDDAAYQESPELIEPGDLAEFRADTGWADQGDLESVIRHCAALVTAVTGAEPIVVRLDHADIGIPSVKVLTPGLRMVDEALLAADPLTPAARRPAAQPPAAAGRE